MLKLDLEKAQEPEIKLHYRKAREFQKNIYFCFVSMNLTILYIWQKWNIEHIVFGLLHLLKVH